MPDREFRVNVTSDLAKFAELIQRHRAAVLAKWREQVRRLPAAENLDVPTLNDHIPPLLDELASNYTPTRSCMGRSAFALGSISSKLWRNTTSCVNFCKSWRKTTALTYPEMSIESSIVLLIAPSPSLSTLMPRSELLKFRSDGKNICRLLCMT